MKNFENVNRTYFKGLGLKTEAENILEILAQSDKPMRCKEIAPLTKSCNRSKRVENDFNYGFHGEPIPDGTPLSVRAVSSLLSQLVELGIVKREEIDGDPYTIYQEKWIEEAKMPPRYIEHDGYKYQIAENVHPVGHWENVPTKRINKVAVFSLA